MKHVRWKVEIVKYVSCKYWDENGQEMRYENENLGGLGLILTKKSKMVLLGASQTGKATADSVKADV